MVHWDRDKAKRILLLQITSLMFIILSFVIISYESDEAVGSSTPLKIQSSFRLPVLELSGIHWEKGKELKIVAVGDRTSTLVSYGMDSKKTEIHDFSKDLIEKYSLCHSTLSDICSKFLKRVQSDWEALRIDGAGTRFLLQEHSESVLMLNKQHKILGSMQFNLMEPYSESVKKSSKKFLENSLGEGLLLLKNGHFLVAKESQPMAIIEFGPKKNTPLGLKPETYLPHGEVFKRAKKEKQTYKALAHWELGASGKCDFSDLEYFNGTLFVLSQKCNQIFMFSPLAAEKTSISPLARLELPKKIKNPEAMTVLPDGRLVIGSDIRSKKDNVFILESPTLKVADR